MRCFSVFVALFFVSSFVNGQYALDGGMSDLLTTEYEVDYQVKQWSDSTDYQFMVITIKQPVIIDTILTIPPPGLNFNQYYCNLSDFYVKRKDCRFYPIKYTYEAIKDTVNGMMYRTMQGLFLVDDFQDDTDSLDLVLHIQSGYMLQSQMNSHDQLVSMLYNPKQPSLTNMALANKRWYKAWLKTNPRDHNPRMYQSEYGGCKD